MPIEQAEVIQAAQDLEPLPPTAARLGTLLCKRDWDIREVEEAISFDQALTAKLLRLSNSALWFRGRAINTVRDAVLRLGSGTVVGLVMGAGVQRRMSLALPQYGLREGELWTHSVASTLAVHVLGSKTIAHVPIEASASALLHDVGKLVMARYLDADHQHRIEEIRRSDGLSQRDAELAVMGLNHAELGGIIGQQWQLPERLVTGIVHHHSPADAPDPIASVVHLADVLAHHAQAVAVGVLRGKEPPPPAPEALACLGITEKDLQDSIAPVADQLSDVLRRYS